MIVRDLERLLCAHGVGGAKLDAVTRKLRECGRLPKGGRGTNAPEIGSNEAAMILIAIAGAGKGIEAEARLAKLDRMRTSSTKKLGKSLVECLASLLDHPAELEMVREVRISRTTSRASFRYVSEETDQFLPNNSKAREDRFQVEGILPRELLQTVAAALVSGQSEDADGT